MKKDIREYLEKRTDEAESNKERDVDLGLFKDAHYWLGQVHAYENMKTKALQEGWTE